MGRNRLHRSVDEHGEIDVVDHQVGNHVDVGDAGRDFVGAGEIDTDHALGLLQYTFENLNGRIESFNKAHLDAQAPFARKRRQALGFSQGAGERFFNKNIAQVPGGALDPSGMRRGRRGDYNGIQSRHRGINVIDAGHVVGGGQLGLSRGIGVMDKGDFDTLEQRQNPEVVLSHIAQANQAQF